MGCKPLPRKALENDGMQQGTAWLIATKNITLELSLPVKFLRFLTTEGKDIFSFFFSLSFKVLLMLSSE